MVARRPCVSAVDVDDDAVVLRARGGDNDVHRNEAGMMARGWRRGSPGAARRRDRSSSR